MRLLAACVVLSLVVACSSSSSSSGGTGSGTPPPTCSPGQVRLVGTLGGASFDETHESRSSELAQLGSPSTLEITYGDASTPSAAGTFRVTWQGIEADDQPFSVTNATLTGVTSGALMGDHCGATGTVTILAKGASFVIDGLGTGACPGASIAGELRGCYAESN